MARKKKAWNMTNPLYRYLHGKSAKKSTKHRMRVAKMARKRHYSRGRGSSGIKGLLSSFLIGAGSATLAEKVAPTVIPYQSVAVGAGAGFLMKKNINSALAGAAGALARDMLKGGTAVSTGNAVSGY